MSEGGRSMVLIASFNYTAPPSNVVWVGVLGAATLILFLGLTCNALGGLLGGGVVTGVIAWFVLGAGRGDMTGLMQLVYAPLLGVVGGLLGGITAWHAALLREAVWRRRQSGHAKNS